MFKVNNKDTRMKTSNIFHTLLSVSIVKFEQVNAGWDSALSRRLITCMSNYQTYKTNVYFLFRLIGFILSASNQKSKSYCLVCLLFPSLFACLRLNLSHRAKRYILMDPVVVPIAISFCTGSIASEIA